MNSRKKDSLAKKNEEYVAVYSEYYPLIFNTVYSKVGDENDAGDVCQEIFLILYEKFYEVENYRKWLFGTLRNVVMRYYEKKSKVELNIDDIFQDISLTFVNGMKDVRIIINNAIENINLNNEERLLLDYIAYNSYSYSNVGEIMGLSKKQVFLRYSKVVKKVLTRLKELGIQDIEDLL